MLQKSPRCYLCIIIINWKQFAGAKEKTSRLALLSQWEKPRNICATFEKFSFSKLIIFVIFITFDMDHLADGIFQLVIFLKDWRRRMAKITRSAQPSNDSFERLRCQGARKRVLIFDEEYLQVSGARLIPSQSCERKTFLPVIGALASRNSKLRDRNSSFPKEFSKHKVHESFAKMLRSQRQRTYCFSSQQ